MINSKQTGETRAGIKRAGLQSLNVASKIRQLNRNTILRTKFFCTVMATATQKDRNKHKSKMRERGKKSNWVPREYFGVKHQLKLRHSFYFRSLYLPKLYHHSGIPTNQILNILKLSKDFIEFFSRMSYALSIFNESLYLFRSAHRRC